MARVDGISVHAKSCVDGRDCKRLERLLNQITRPALAQDRLHILGDDRVPNDMKRIRIQSEHSGASPQSRVVLSCPGANIGWTSHPSLTITNIEE